MQSMLYEKTEIALTKNAIIALIKEIIAQILIVSNIINPFFALRGTENLSCSAD